VTGGHRIVEYAQTVALPGLKEPLKPPVAISGELETEFLLMAPMGNLPPQMHHPSRSFVS